MQLFKIAVSSQCLNQPLPRAVRTIAELGAQGVELDVREELRPTELSETGRRQFLQRLTELNLQVAAFHFPMRRALTDQEHLDDRVAAIKQALDFGWPLKCSRLAVRIGKIPADEQSPPYRLLREVLEDLARHGNHVGVTLCITPTQDSPAALKTLIEGVRTGPLGVNFDPASFVASGHNPVAAFRVLHDLCLHFQARDAIRDMEGQGQEVPVGRGETDWVELLALAHEAEYRGWINVNRTQGDDRPGDAARAVQFLHNVFF